MACESDLTFAKTRINMLDYISHIPHKIHTEEIELFCKIIQKKPMSIQSIYDIIGGQNSNYQCMEVGDYQVTRFCEQI